MPNEFKPRNGLVIETETATTVPYLDANKKLVSSAVTPTELGYVSGVTSAVQTQINAKAPTASPTFSGTITTPLTASRALVTGASSELGASATTATELGYVNGVTSAIQTQLDAKVAKSTLTTKGDIYVATGASTVTRLGVGADNTFLKADSGEASGLIWASPSGSALAVASKTTTYTATTADDVILASTSGGAWTLTLYAASGNSGKVLRIVKTTNDFSVLTIDGNASETINGSTTTTINTQYESLTIICDGSNWHILDRRIPSATNTYTPTIKGSTSDPTVGYSRQAGYWKREGDSILIKVQIIISSYSGGSGQLYISMPSGLTIDNTKTTDSTSTEGSLGGGIFYDSSATTNYAIGVLADTSVGSSTGFYIALNGTNTILGITEVATSDQIGLWAKFPITNWKG